MNENALINNSEKYGGQYVTTESFQSKDVITHGTDPVKVYTEAKERGIPDPVIFFVLEENITCIF